MFGLDFEELLTIFFVALFVVGPRELPNLARILGRALRDLHQAAQEAWWEISAAPPLADGRESVPDREWPASAPDILRPVKATDVTEGTTETAQEETRGSGERRLTFVGHLIELRNRLFWCLVGAGAGMATAWYLYDPFLLNLLRAPLDVLTKQTDNPWVSRVRFYLPATTMPSAGFSLHFTSPSEAFMMKLQTAFVVGTILASPFIFYHLWAFVAEGLTRSEKRAVRRLLPPSVFLFWGGVLVAYFLVLPMTLYFLVVVSGKGLVPMLTLRSYLAMVTGCLLAFGFMFQLPIVVLFLVELGIVSPEGLARQRRVVILLVFIVAGIVSPPDIFSQLLLAIPMVILYEISLLVARRSRLHPMARACRRS